MNIMGVRDAEALGDRLPLEEMSAVFDEYPVRLAICFGSQVRGKTHGQSDIDIAVAFDGLEPGDDGYNDVLFGLMADLAITTDRDDIDLIDIHTVQDRLAAVIFDSGIVIYGDENRLVDLDTIIEGSSPRERLDTAVAGIDRHLQ